MKFLAISHQVLGHLIFPDWLQPFEKGLPGDAPISENVEVKKYSKKDDVVYPPPVLAEESKTPRSSKPTSKPDLVHIFLKNRISKCPTGQRSSEPTVRINLMSESIRVLKRSSLQTKEFLVKGVNRNCSTCTQWWYKSCTPLGFRVILREPKKLERKRRYVCDDSFLREKNPKSRPH